MSKYEKNDVNVMTEKNRKNVIFNIVYLKGRSCA